MPRSAALALALALPAALLPQAVAAQEAGLTVILDAQSADMVDRKYCVFESKLYSPNAEVCINKLRKLTCQAADPNDATKGLAWAASDDQKRCGPR